MEVFAAGFTAELVRLGYRRAPAAFQLQLMAHASRWLERKGFGAGELTSEVVERFLAERRAAGYTNYVTARAMAALNRRRCSSICVVSALLRHRCRGWRSGWSRCCWPTIAST